MARILLGASGGVACYKAVELVRLATQAGHALRVVQTPAALRFVGRATFEAVSAAPVLVDEFEPDPARGAFPGDAAPTWSPISHLELAQRCDVYVIAPATANTLAKLANGLADNLLTSAALACTAPVVVAPAMNAHMYAHPATQANLATLRAGGAAIVEPDTGSLASPGEWGVGRLAEPAEILAAAEGLLERTEPTADLAGVRALVTAGGTREPIDAVRYVSNRSSGRMGYTVASEFARRGARVCVVSANVALERERGIDYRDVETAAELEQATRELFSDADVLVMAAAVSDFRPADVRAGKIASGSALTVALEPTTDVLADLGAERRGDQTLVGFAAEYGPFSIERAQRKLREKAVDAIVVNDISQPGIGFDALDNEVTLVTAHGASRQVRGSKQQVADAVVDLVCELRAGAERRDDVAR